MLQGTSSTQPEISCHIMQVFNSVSKITGTDTVTVVLQPTFSWMSKEQLLSRWCKTSWLVQNSSQGFRGCQSRCATGYCGRDLCLWHWNSSWSYTETPDYNCGATACSCHCRNRYWIILGEKPPGVRQHQKIFHRVLISGKKRALRKEFKGSKDEFWEQEMSHKHCFNQSTVKTSQQHWWR